MESNKFENLCDLVFVQRKNVYLWGPGGTGKSTMMKKLHKQAFRNNKVSYLTSATGYAALQIGGQTLHKWAGILLGKGTSDELFQLIMKNKKSLYRWQKVDVLMIDEISMIGAELLDKLSLVAQKIKNNMQPFGGITLVVSGDFLQLKPIRDKFAFDSQVWKLLNFHIEEFETPYRFINGEYFSLLQRARIGKLTQDDINALHQRLVTEKTTYKGIKPTVIHSMNIDVSSSNVRELDNLGGDFHTYSSQDIVQSKKKCNNTLIISKNKKNLDGLIQPDLVLKNGAQVMLIINLDAEKKLVNGSRGIVIECQDDQVVVDFGYAQETITQHPFELDVTEDSNEIKIVRFQIPLILAYSLTFHRVQGATLDCAEINLGNSVFASNMAYVGLSRVRSLEGLYLISFNKNKIVPDPIALKFENELRNNKK